MDALRTGTAALALVGMGWIGISTLSGAHETPRATESITVAAAAPSAYGCAVHCETDWHNGDIGATDRWFGTPIGAIGPPAPPAVVYLHVPAEVVTVQQGSTSKATSAPKAAKVSSSKAGTPKASKAPAAPKAPKASVPSTTTTVTSKTSTSTHSTAKGSTTTQSSSTSTRTTHKG